MWSFSGYLSFQVPPESNHRRSVFRVGFKHTVHLPTHYYLLLLCGTYQEASSSTFLWVWSLFWQLVDLVVSSTDTLGSAVWIVHLCPRRLVIIFTSHVYIAKSNLPLNSPTWGALKSLLTPHRRLPGACVLWQLLRHSRLILSLSFLPWFRKMALFKHFIVKLGTYRLLFKCVVFSKACRIKVHTSVVGKGPWGYIFSIKRLSFYLLWLKTAASPAAK